MKPFFSFFNDHDNDDGDDDIRPAIFVVQLSSRFSAVSFSARPPSLVR